MRSIGPMKIVIVLDKPEELPEEALPAAAKH